MARLQKPPRGRLIISVIHSSLDACADALRALEKQFGRIHSETTDLPCSNASHYREEMGDRLHRRFFSFQRMVERDALPELKVTCQKIEAQLGDRVEDYTFRAVNLDPGMIAGQNLIMACGREFNHRIYLTDGVFAELSLVWSRDRFVRLPWTDEDFCHPEAIEFFTGVIESLEPLKTELSRV